jgi:hypothetical protein
MSKEWIKKAADWLLFFKISQYLQKKIWRSGRDLNPRHPA